MEFSVREMLANVSRYTNLSIFVFDGAYPYRGMLNAIKGRVGVKRVWVRRGESKRQG